MLNKTHLENALIFLGRADLKGNEAQPFMELVSAIQQERQILLREEHDQQIALLTAPPVGEAPPGE